MFYKILAILGNIFLRILMIIGGILGISVIVACMIFPAFFIAIIFTVILTFFVDLDNGSVLMLTGAVTVAMFVLFWFWDSKKSSPKNHNKSNQHTSFQNENSQYTHQRNNAGNHTAGGNHQHSSSQKDNSQHTHRSANSGSYKAGEDHRHSSSKNENSQHTHQSANSGSYKTGENQGKIFVSPEVGQHYATLGLAYTATKDEVRQKYKELVRQYHPDNYYAKGDAYVQEASKRFREINHNHRPSRWFALAL